MGVSMLSVSFWENSKVTPTYDAYRKIRKLLQEED